MHGELKTLRLTSVREDRPPQPQLFSKRTRAHSTGLSLLEVLIALLVLSVGLIGVAVLTVQSLQNIHSSLYTSLASAAALNFEERLWLELGSDPEDLGCPDAQKVKQRVRGAWRDGTVANKVFLTLPDFDIDMDPPTPPTPGSDRMQLDLTLTWDEERFEGENGESFEYRIVIPCKVATGE